MEIGEFRKIILSHYRHAGRTFPWRNTETKKVSPWGVLVSEFMLQQTQTERVVPYWEKWMRLWPTPKALAEASLEESLREWSGLGYNRRCLYLKNSAALIANDYKGRVPASPESLHLLPGIGPYTAGAIACFAYNYPAVFIETNIRSAVIHCFFPGRDDVKDKEIIPILEDALDRSEPGTWYYALMDYGASLKKLTKNPGRRSAHYAKQSPFTGSFRQARGKVIRALALKGPSDAEQLLKESGLEEERLYVVLDKLKNESMVAEEKGIYRIMS